MLDICQNSFNIFDNLLVNMLLNENGILELSDYRQSLANLVDPLSHLNGSIVLFYLVIQSACRRG